jgi:hypothetical protein
MQYNENGPQNTAILNQYQENVVLWGYLPLKGCDCQKRKTNISITCNMMDVPGGRGIIRQSAHILTKPMAKISDQYCMGIRMVISNSPIL